MTKHKNALLIGISIILLGYAGFISIFPAILTNSFNIQQFEQKVYDATSLVTKVGSIEYKIKPNFETIITLTNWSSKYIDEQDCFDASLIQLTTTPAAIFTKNFTIKDLYLKNVKFSNQRLPEGENKLAFLPKVLNTKIFGKNKITVTAGPVRVKNFQIKYIAPGYYKESNRKEENYTKTEVRNFLKKMDFTYVNIK